MSPPRLNVVRKKLPFLSVFQRPTVTMLHRSETCRSNPFPKHCPPPTPREPSAFPALLRGSHLQSFSRSISLKKSTPPIKRDRRAPLQGSSRRSHRLNVTNFIERARYGLGAGGGRRERRTHVTADAYRLYRISTDTLTDLIYICLVVYGLHRRRVVEFSTQGSSGDFPENPQRKRSSVYKVRRNQ